MQQLTDISSCLTAAQTFAIKYGSQLSEPALAILSAALSSVSGVETICGVAETLYGNMDEFSGEGLVAAQTLCGQLACFAGMNGWHNLRDNRGFQIMQAMQRDLGEPYPLPGQSWPAASTDPEPLAQYCAPKVPSAEEVAASLSTAYAAAQESAASLSTALSAAQSSLSTSTSASLSTVQSGTSSLSTSLSTSASTSISASLSTSQ